MFGDRPRGKSAEPIPIHADAAVAPRLRSHPFDDRLRILAVEFQRHCRRRPLGCTACLRHHPGIPVGGALLREIEGPIEPEFEQRRQLVRRRWANDPHRQIQPARGLDRDFRIDIASTLIFGLERRHQGRPNSRYASNDR